jgi:DNA-binding GntR family transcriptional regulator
VARARSTQADLPRLRDQAYETLRAQILSGELEAGSFISERQMVQALGMSKTPIRVAFERLARDGFVEILPQRGVRVRALSTEEIVEHYDLRIALETWVARGAAAAATADVLAALDARIAAQRTLQRRVRGKGRPAGAELSAYINEDAQFHAILAEAAGNAEIARVLDNQRERLGRVVAEHIRAHPAVLTSSIAEHVAIRDALAAGDGERAAAAMAAHLERGKASLLSAGDPQQARRVAR